MGREHALELAVEELVEGATRNSGPFDQVPDCELGKAKAGGGVDRCRKEALALLGDDDVGWKRVRAAR